MKLVSLVVWPVVVAAAAWGCSSTDTPAVPGPSSGSAGSSGAAGSGRASGSGSALGSSGSPVSSGAGSSGGASGMGSGGSSGLSASGGSTSGTSSGSVLATDAGGDATSGSSGGADAAGSGSNEGGTGSGTDASGGVSLWYEAEAIPPNVLTNGSNVATCAGSAQYGRGASCALDTLKEGALCCSGGKLVVSLLGRSNNNAGSGLEFHNVSVPTDGPYDVTWWYHCGANDFFGDRTCGGLHYPVGTSCRPHLIDVNGAAVTGTADGGTAQFFQFPCYPGDWSIIHAANTTLQLKAGNNVIYIHPPHNPVLDAADIDVIHVTPPGQGTGLNITPVAIPN